MNEEITNQACAVVTELLELANLKPGSLFVIGCSSSDMVGGAKRKRLFHGGCSGRFSGNLSGFAGAWN